MLRRVYTAILLSMILAAPALAADTKSHRLLIQVDQNDPDVMNLALNNATNVIEYYRTKEEAVDVDIVTFGPGLNMLRADTSPVQERIKHFKELAFPGKNQFSACNVLRSSVSRRAWPLPKTPFASG